MKDSDNKSDHGTDSVHNEDQHNEDQHKQHDGFEQHDEGEDDTAPELADSPQLGSSPSQKSEASQNPVGSVPTTNPGTPSSSGSFSDHDQLYPNALRIFRGDPEVSEDLTEITGGLEYTEMRKCVNAALSILSRTQTRNVMVVYSIGVVDSMETSDSVEPSEHRQSTAGDLEVYDGGMEQAISNWLEKLRRRFPNLYINPSTGDRYGYTERLTWGTHIDDYFPELAALISINPEVRPSVKITFISDTESSAKLFDRMCTLKQRVAEYDTKYVQDWQPKLDQLEAAVQEAQKSNEEDAIDAAESDLGNYQEMCDARRNLTKSYKIHYERTLFVLAVTIAHECFHVLTGYWTGVDEAFTPPDFFGELPKVGRGEAGEWWEFKHGFNGSANLVWNNRGKEKDDPYPLDNEKMSAGIPFLKQIRYRDDESVGGATWTRISHNFIRDVLEKGKSNVS